MSEYKPGDVAVATVRGVPNVRVMRTSAERDLWISMEYDGRDYPNGMGSITWHGGDQLTDARPLAVIDPEDEDAAERIVKAFVVAGCWRVIPADVENSHAHRRKQVQAALREYADPTPPKPPEPKGRYAEVEDAEGYVWFRDPVGSWRRTDSAGNYFCHSWESVPAVKVLSEGVRDV